MDTLLINDELSQYPYDREKCTEVVELELDNDVLIKLATMAHDREITLNHLMNAIIAQEIERVESLGNAKS